MKNKKNKDYLDNIQKPLFTLDEDALREILDLHWYPATRDAVVEQRRIWDYAYLAYKGIMLWEEVNRKRRANEFGLYVNVPRTFSTIEGVRRHFNLSKLRVALEYSPDINDSKRKAISAFLNYDIKRGGTIEQVKDAAFYKLLYGNGFLVSYLAHRTGKYGKITGDIDKKTGVVKNRLDKDYQTKYFGMVAKAISPYNVFPDPDGVSFDYNDVINSPANYVCIRTVKHINSFKRDWRGVVPDEILDSVEPGGKDMTNYEVVKDTIDSLFNYDALRYSGTLSEYIKEQKIEKVYNSNEYVEERVWYGEDFYIMQAGKGLKFCIISPNPNPKKESNIIKLDDVRVPGEFWAMGEPYIMRYQQIEENRIHNAVLDTLHFAISGMVGLNTQYLEDEYDTEIYPQKVWKLKAMPGVKIDEMIQTFQPNSSGIAPALKFMEEVKKVGQSTTSITDFVTGASKSLADTATEAQKLSGASDMAIADKIKEIAGGALTKVAKNFISFYPVSYSDEKIEMVEKDAQIVFVGQTKKEIEEKKLTELLKKYENPNHIIFLDDVDIVEPRFFITGEVSLDRTGKLAQWSSAIDYAKSINEVAYSTGDPRRIDVVKMGLMALENFDVIENTDEFLMENQPTKMDEIELNAEMNQQAAMNAQNYKMQNEGGRPKENKITQPQTQQQRIRQTAQPNNRNKNQLSKKNV